MAIDSDGGGRAKKQRVDERAAGRHPHGLTGAIARGWRDLWKTRWPHRASVEVPLGSPDAPRRKLDALARKPRRRLDSFSLVIKNCKLKSWELRAFTDYAAECGVDDLHVEVRRGTLVAAKLHFPTCSPLLARLSLRRVGIISSPVYYKGAKPFRALEVIRLRSVSITEVGFKNMMAL
ncbi:hypothetical protein HU200_059108 [Digitaria exilis]|uniref:Uncharacterized protein n=1 Tax=Digitaria exilis TaxID=1010633 RepID=A0A835A8L4_9POAL|nr:hypothetical protein HU200_059108 [Digitaria exilis]